MTCVGAIHFRMWESQASGAEDFASFNLSEMSCILLGLFDLDFLAPLISRILPRLLMMARFSSLSISFLARSFLLSLLGDADLDRF